MGRAFVQGTSKLMALVVLSSVLGLTVARAHEVQPTIADLSVAEGQVALVLELNLEAFFAGIDLDGLQDTDDAANAEGYDALRALPDADLMARAPELLSPWNRLPMVRLNGAPVTLRSGAISVPEQVDIELPRVTRWQLLGDAPAVGAEVEVIWPKGGGAMVLRQQGVEEPYTGFLNGGDTSDPIVFEGGATNTWLLVSLLGAILIVGAGLMRLRRR